MTVASGELQRCVMTGEGRFTAGVFFAVSVVRTAKNLGFPEDGRTVIPEVLIDTKEHRGDHDIAGNVILFQDAVLIVLKPPFPCEMARLWDRVSLGIQDVFQVRMSRRWPTTCSQGILLRVCRSVHGYGILYATRLAAQQHALWWYRTTLHQREQFRQRRMTPHGYRRCTAIPV